MLIRLNQNLSANMRLMTVLSMVLVGMILITSQSQSAFAGSCPNNGQDNDNDGYCGNIDDCDDNDPNVTAEHGCNPALDIENLIDDIEELIEEGSFDINKGQTNAILGKLDKAADRIESDKINAAIGSLNAFINQINAFINSGSISTEDGQTLIDTAQGIIDSL